MELEICKLAPPAWDRRSISSVCSRVTSGGTPSRKNPRYYAGTIPWIKSKELRDGWIEATEEHISEKALTESSAKLLKPHSVLMAMYGATVGQLGLLRREATCNQAACVMETNESVANFRYLYYQLLLHRSQIKSLATGAAQQNLSATTIRSFVLPFPPVDEQREIARTLGALDDKIALNRQTNHALEELARGIFQAWFVDFLPTRAKEAARSEGRDPVRAAMCAMSRKDEAALDSMGSKQYEQLAATAALFPDELMDSELGEVPFGWKVLPLPEALEINPPRPLRKGAATPYVDMASVPTNSARVAHLAVRAFASGSKFRNGDTLLARITPCLENGKTAFVDCLEPGEVGWGSTEFIVLRPKPPLPEPFAYFLCRDPGFRSFSIANMAGTSGRQRVPNDCFANYHIAVPDGDTAQAFGRFATGCLDLMRARDAESQTLAELRDSLLPKLLSGEIRVGEAQELVEAAA